MHAQSAQLQCKRNSAKCFYTDKTELGTVAYAQHTRPLPLHTYFIITASVNALVA